MYNRTKVYVEFEFYAIKHTDFTLRKAFSHVFESISE